ncbi:MAG: sarcosine oxidase subunit gamma, partial [Alphaproteobacteria bacterium]|nr:sarcosine oxidase subunit gamma [Alphaproteobacteria bacterium]
MAELIALSPLAGHVPLTVGRFDLTEADLGPIHSVAPLPGRRAALDAALLAAGFVFPAPPEMREGPAGRMVWAGRDLAFLMGAAPSDAVRAAAAVTDQSDGWAALRLSGRGIADVLARLVPVDCGDGPLPPG